MAASVACGALAVAEVSLGREPGVLVTSVVLLLVFWASFKSMAGGRLASCRALTWLGFVSYPLYLIHQNFVTGLAIELHGIEDGLWPWLYPTMALAVAISLALLVAKAEPAIKTAITACVPRRPAAT